MRDEGPSEDDLARFDRDVGYCPDCGEEIWDQSEFCAACGAYLAGNVVSQPPVERAFRAKWIILVAVVLLVLFLIRVL